MPNGYNQYIGMRYVPIVDGDWSNSKAYEPLVVVVYNGNSYISKTYVPAGTLPTNETYWILAANYNAQVEQYRQEVRQYSDTASDIADKYDGLVDDMSDINHNMTELLGKVSQIETLLDGRTPVRFNLAPGISNYLNQYGYGHYDPLTDKVTIIINGRTSVNITLNDTLFVIPEGYRPPANYGSGAMFVIDNGNAVAYTVTARTDGRITQSLGNAVREFMAVIEYKLTV